jgi:hypothetical protein
VRKVNLCGRGDYSATKAIDISSRPEKMAAPVLSISECSLRFDWSKPDDGNSPLLDYYVEVLDTNGEW